MGGLKHAPLPNLRRNIMAKSGAHLPNGLSTQTTSAQNTAAGAGALDCSTLYADTVNAGTVIGDLVSMTFTMGSVSTARIVYGAVPITGNVVRASVVIGATVGVNTLHTFLLGSAGASITTVTSDSGTVGLVTTTTTITNPSVTVGDSIECTRAVQGTAGDTWATIVIQKT